MYEVIFNYRWNLIVNYTLQKYSPDISDFIMWLLTTYLTAGVSAQPGCMTLQWISGCALAHSSVISTCCLLFWAYAIVPSYLLIDLNCKSSTCNFCVSIPPELTVTTRGLSDFFSSGISPCCHKLFFYKEWLQPIYSSILTQCHMHLASAWKLFSPRFN